VSPVDPAASAGAQGVALGYEPPAGPGEGRIWIPSGGSHLAGDLSGLQARRLVSAVLEVRPEPEGRLVLLGVEVDGLTTAGRLALRDRIGFLPADGGLLSNLNAWENMVLPLGFHHPERMRAVAAQVNGVLGDLGTDPRALLDKLPEKMSLYEKKLTAYVRIMWETPDLVLAEEPQGGLDAGERAAAARFPAIYLKSCPGGTFVQLEVAPGR
jgi:ABC-type transporter Mla maintaining outer membrane lipid asymmetry ATPase subunit MlaF